MEKRLTPTMRATYESHKSAVRERPKALEKIQADERLDLVGPWKKETPEEYIKKITIDEEIALGKFIEKIITLGSSQGFVAFMMLYQYMYDKNLLGQEIEEITAQEIIDHIYAERSYKLKPKNKQAFLASIIHLSGLQFYIKSNERTEEIRKKVGSETDVIFTSFTLLKVKEIQTLADEKTVRCIRGVSIMKDFINLWFKKMSRLFIPLEDILKIERDRNGDHKRGFNLSLALRHAELGIRKDYVEWTLEQCLNVGQWQPQRHKTRTWQIVIDSLEAGKNQQLIDYEFVYKPKKPQVHRYISKVIIRRLWKTAHQGTLKLNVDLESIKASKSRVVQKKKNDCWKY